MKNSLDNYNLLIEKLDKFIRKYYTNKIIKGLIYFFTLAVALFLVFNLLESQFYFSKLIRKSIFYIFIISTIVAFLGWIALPIGKYFQLGKTISREQAALIVGNHFSNIKDKLLNVLQLHSQSRSNMENDLLLAGIDQKSEEIKLVPFRSAIDLSKNKKYLKYLIPPFIVLFVILLASPGTIQSSTKRIINNDKDFEQPAPFHFKVKNDKLEVVQFDDLDLYVSVFGEYLPSELYIDIDGYRYRLNKESDSTFLYHFKNIQKDINFKLFSGKVLTGSNNWVNAVSGSRYVSWLPSFSVEVTHTSLLPGQQLRLQTQTSQLDNMVGTACCLTFNSVCAFGVVQWLLPDMKNIVMQGLVFFWMAGCGIILTLGFAQTL